MKRVCLFLVGLLLLGLLSGCRLVKPDDIYYTQREEQTPEEEKPFITEILDAPEGEVIETPLLPLN